MKRDVATGLRNSKLAKRSMMTAFCVLATGSILGTTETFAGTTTTSQVNRDVNYQTEATTAVQGLIGSYWNSSAHQFENTPGGSYTGNYWWEANALYTLADAGLTTNSKTYNHYISSFIAGLQKQYGTHMYDSWNDDEGWLGIALMQAFKAMGTSSTAAFPVAPTVSGGMNNPNSPALVQDAEALQADIQKSWTPEGGVTWDKPSAGPRWYNQFYRDTAANMTDAILSAELYTATRHQSYLADAEQLFHWEWNTLVLPRGGTVSGTHYQPGTVMDGVDWNPLSQQNTYPNGGTAQWTYNYGVVIGAAVELFKLTGNSKYAMDAELVANAGMNQFAKADGVMAGVETGGGDGGLFKGIFMRYMIQLLKLDGQNRNLYNFVQANLSALWSRDQASTPGIFGNNWAGPAPLVSSVDLSDELSGVMALTSMATYQQAAQNFPSQSSVASPQGTSVYSAIPAMMESTNASAPYSYFVQVGGLYEPDNRNIGGWGDGKGNEAVVLPIWTEHPGPTTLTMRYSNGSNTAPRDLYINGILVGSLSFNSTGGWDAWSTVGTTVNLLPGKNVIALVAPTSPTGVYINLNQIITSVARPTPRQQNSNAQ